MRPATALAGRRMVVGPDRAHKGQVPSRGCEVERQQLFLSSDPVSRMKATSRKKRRTAHDRATRQEAKHRGAG
jgi:hypothetical protein